MRLQKFFPTFKNFFGVSTIFFLTPEIFARLQELFPGFGNFEQASEIFIWAKKIFPGFQNFCRALWVLLRVSKKIFSYSGNFSHILEIFSTFENFFHEVSQGRNLQGGVIISTGWLSPSLPLSGNGPDCLLIAHSIRKTKILTDSYLW